MDPVQIIGYMEIGNIGGLGCLPHENLANFKHHSPGF